MTRGQFVYYLALELMTWADYDVCNLPGVGFFRIKDSPYILMLGRTA